MHWDGMTWSRLDEDFPVDGAVVLRDVWGVGPDNIWIVGDGGRLFHFDGDTWQQVDAGTSANLYSVYATSPTDVWIAGDAGTILHYNGQGWKSNSPAAGQAFSDIWTAGPGDVWAVGFDGTIAYYDGANWSYPLEIGKEYWSVWGTAVDSLWIAGGTAPAGTPQLLQLERTLPRMNGGVCKRPLPLYCGANISGAITPAADMNFQKCSNIPTPGGAVYYRFHSPITGELTITLTPSASDLDLMVLPGHVDGSCDNDSPCLYASQNNGIASETVTMDVDREQFYYFVVDGKDTTPGGYSIAVDCTRTSF
jgi:hypothetical protein